MTTKTMTREEWEYARKVAIDNLGGYYTRGVDEAIDEAYGATYEEYKRRHKKDDEK